MSTIGEIFTVRRYGSGPHDWQIIPRTTAVAVDTLLDHKGTRDSLTAGRRRAADLVRGIESELDGELTPAEVAAINAIYARFSGGAAGTTSRVGITSDAQQVIDKGRAERDHNNAIIRRIKEAGDKQAAMWRA